MRVKMVQQVSGGRNGVPWPAPGEEIEVSQEEANDLLLNGQAVAANLKAEPADSAAAAAEAAAKATEAEDAAALKQAQADAKAASDQAAADQKAADKADKKKA